MSTPLGTLVMQAVHSIYITAVHNPHTVQYLNIGTICWWLVHVLLLVQHFKLKPQVVNGYGVLASKVLGDTYMQGRGGEGKGGKERGWGGERRGGRGWGGEGRGREGKRGDGEGMGRGEEGREGMGRGGEGRGGEEIGRGREGMGRGGEGKGGDGEERGEEGRGSEAVGGECDTQCTHMQPYAYTYVQ